jgi:hypothetical protein
MKKLATLLAIVLLVFSLAQCSLFTTKIKYLVTSADTEPMQILYQAGSDMTEVTANNFWNYEVDILTSDKPQLAFIRVSKSSGTPFTVEIQKDNVQVATDTKTPLATIELYHVVE